ncbi:MAG: type IV toxin-antitoxin system AbiEi family antitoxin, partial [Thermodesulfobacteriota bacterium]|nr:type IV toxin-antitoxin system AbiEi family antitoxin [Thermodesulfobacteriota bacterium]
LTPGDDVTHILERLKQLPHGKQILLGGELGAALLTSHFKPQTAILYLPPELLLKTMLQLHLLPDPKGEITLLQPFGQHCSWSGWQPEGITLADPLLIFAELCGSNTDEVAEKLYRQYLAPRLES